MIDTLLKDGWLYHTQQADRIADELEALDLSGVSEAQITPLLLLSNHVMGEHLAQWNRARKIAEKLVVDGSKSSENWGLLSVCRYMDGDQELAISAQIESVKQAGEATLDAIFECKILVAKALLINKQADIGLPFFKALIDAAQVANILPQTIRKFAIACHNIADHLTPISNKNEALNCAMLAAANAALYFWQKCGTWLHAERGLYLLQIIQNQLSQHDAALKSAVAALEIIKTNGGEPIDEAFIRLEKAKSHKQLGEHARADEQLLAADELASLWNDASLYDLYQAQKSKV